ncbi:MAG: helix-turn-helix domain-containing protein [Acidimicrobiia bacterium]
MHPNYRWISSVRAAERLGVSIRDLYRLIDRGDVPGYRIAGEIRLLADEVEDFHEKLPDRGDPL